MSDEFQHRYQHLSHSQLYNQLMAGDPEQVEGLASDWSSLETTVSDLAHSLRTDLDKLQAGWQSASGTEYSRRIGLIKTYAEDLATEFSNVQQGLTLMADPLRKAQKHAESPDETDDNDKAVKGAVVGGLVGGPVGAAIGGFFGHKKDEEEEEKAHQRMVKLVANLASEYDTTYHAAWSNPVPVPPPDLPGEPTGGPTSPTGGPRVTTPTSGPRTGTVTTPEHANVPPPHSPAHGPDSANVPGSTAPGSTGPDGFYTSLAGADGGLSGGLLGGWAAGAGGVLLAAGAATRSGSQIGALASENPLPTGAVLGAGAGMGGTGTGGTGMEGKSAAAPGRGMGAQRGGSDVLGRNSENGRAAIGGRREGQEDEADERTTWLTEDEMVWDGDQRVAPSLLDGDAV